MDLEVRIQSIFNNLIKQNQKLGSNSILQQSTTVSRVQSPEFSVQSPASRVQRPESSVQSPASRVRRPESGVQSPAFRVQRPGSSIHSPASSSCVQSPGVPVCLFFTHSFQVRNYGILDKHFRAASEPNSMWHIHMKNSDK